MVKQINRYKDASLSNLDWTPGELIAFDNTDIEWSSPLILAIPKKIVKGYQDSPLGMKLLYCPLNGKREGWTLYPEGDILGLESPNYKGNSKVPHFQIITEESFLHRNLYFVEAALAGREAIEKYLQKNDLSFYAGCLKSGKLVTERNQLEKFMQKIGIGFILPNQLRFKK